MKRFFTIIMLMAFMSVTVAGSFAAVEAQKDPKECVKYYYWKINEKKLRAAYGVKSQRAKRAQSFQAWEKTWNNNISVGIYDATLKVLSESGNRAVVGLSLSAEDKVPGNKIRIGNYDVKITLVKSDGVWWADDFSVKTNDEGVHPAPVYYNRKPDPLPQGVPIYPGFKMGPARVYKEDFHKVPRNGMRAVERKKKIFANQIADYYTKKLKPLGWTTMGPAGGGSVLGIEFKKGKQRVYISAYNTVWNGTDAPSDPRGTMLEIEYWKE